MADQGEDAARLQQVIDQVGHRLAIRPVEGLRERDERGPPKVERAEVFRPPEHPPQVRHPSMPCVTLGLSQHLPVRVEPNDLGGVQREIDCDRPRPAPHIERPPASEVGFAGEELGQGAGIGRAAAQVEGGGAREERGVVRGGHAGILSVPDAGSTPLGGGG